jgi:antitoxin component YwqK of YwqJK toxin-antitoxin module
MGNKMSSNCSEHIIKDVIRSAIKLNSLKSKLTKLPDGMSLFEDIDDEENVFRIIGELDKSLTSNVKISYNKKLIYDGKIKNGEMHGYGRLYFFNGNREYSGHFHKGFRHGKGLSYYEKRIFKSKLKKKYNGNWKNNKYNGKGKLYHSNGIIEYSGNFSDGLYHGYGVLSNKKGINLLSGYWIHGNYYGSSTEYNKDGYNVDGKNVNGQTQRIAIYNWGNKKEHILAGDIKNKIPCGQATHYINTDTGRCKLYQGNWSNGSYHGEGVQYYKPCWKYNNVQGLTEYNGNWNMGEREGNGILFTKGKKSTKYQGMFLNSYKHGKGKLYTVTYKWNKDYRERYEYNNVPGYYYCDEKIVYDGNWSNDLMHGEGTSYYDSGQKKFVGIWNNGKTDIGVLYDENGLVINY